MTAVAANDNTPYQKLTVGLSKFAMPVANAPELITDAIARIVLMIVPLFMFSPYK